MSSPCYASHCWPIVTLVCSSILIHSPLQLMMTSPVTCTADLDAQPLSGAVIHAMGYHAEASKVCAGAATPRRQWPEPAATVCTCSGASDAPDDALRHDALPCSRHADGSCAGIPAHAAPHSCPCRPAAGAPAQQRLCRCVCSSCLCAAVRAGQPAGLAPQRKRVAKAGCAQARSGCAGFQAFNPRFRGDGAGAAGEAAPRGRPPQVRVRMVQVNLRALLQLAVVAIILYQVRQLSLPVALLYTPSVALPAPCSMKMRSFTV